MSWLGKIIGGGLGFVMGGPLGALIGAGLGHTFLDRNMDDAARRRLTGGEQRQTVFFATVFAMLGKMAKADGVVSRAEIDVVERFMRENLRLHPQARRFAADIFNRAKDDPTPFQAYAEQFGQVFAAEPHLRAMLFELLVAVATADGTLHDAESRILKEAMGPLGIPPHVYERLVARSGHADLADHYRLLGIPETATDEEVKRAYRKAAREYHPDTVISKGLPEEFLRFAEEKFKSVNAAYETIMKHRKARAAS